MKYNLDTTVNHRVATLARLLKRQIFRLIAERGMDITPEQWVVLYYLWEKDGQTLGELAGKTRKDFANVTRIVEKLVRQGYVEKRKNPQDSRSCKIYVLPAGKAIREDIFRLWEESAAISLQGISPEEQQILLDVLAKMEANIVAAANA